MSDYAIYNGAYSGQAVDAAIARALSGGEIDTEIAALKSAVGSPLKASTVAGMTDTNKIYVYTGAETGYTAGHWYYWNGSTWADGGVYNATAFVTDKTLAVANAAADGKAVGDAITVVRDAVKSGGDLTNDIHSLVNYGYDTPYYQPEVPSGSWKTKTGIKRDGPVMVLNKSTNINYDIRLKFTGDIDIAYSNATVDVWTTGVSLKAGHEYDCKAKLISGASTNDGETLLPTISCYRVGEHNTIGSSTRDGSETHRFITAEDGVQYNFCFYISKNQYMFTNAKILITLEDLTESEAVRMQMEIDEIKYNLYTTEINLKSGNITPTGIAGGNNAYIRSVSGTLPIVSENDTLEVDGDYEIYNVHVFSKNSISSRVNVATLTVTDVHSVAIPLEYVGKYVGVTLIKTSMVGEDISAYVEDAKAHTRIVQRVPIAQEFQNFDNRITALETGNSVPEYYFDENYLLDKVAAINTIASALTSKQSLQTVFLTDYHLETNARKSPALIEYLINSTGIRNVIFGGDAIDHDYNSKVGGYNLLCKFLADFKKVRETTNFYCITGNHEFNNPDRKHNDGELNSAVIYNLFNTPDYFKITPISTVLNAFYIDDDCLKLRIYCLGCNSGANILWGDLTTIFNSFTSVPDGYSVVIFSHIGCDAYTKVDDEYVVTSLYERFEDILAVAKAMNDGATAEITLTVEEITYTWTHTFTASEQRPFLCAFTGHTHIDSYYIYDGRFPVILTLCDTGAYRDTHPLRVAGTITEQGFDVIQIDPANNLIYMTRIGYGNDRIFRYGENAGIVT